MRTIRRLIYGEVLSGVGFVTVCFLCLFFFFDFVEEIQSIGRHGAQQYQLVHALSYVALIGEARVVRDRATKAAHWDKAWDAFYPDRDSSVVLIEIRAQQLEVVSSTLGIAGDSRTWRPPTVQLAPPATPRPSRSRRRF